MTHFSRKSVQGLSLLALTLAAAGCGSGPVTQGRADGSVLDGGELFDAGGLSDAGGLPDAGCHALLPPEDAPRKVVVSHPYADGGIQDNRYQVLQLASDGTLSLGETFRMGRQTFGNIAFTPDGKVGLAPQDDGSIGVFRFAPAGQVEVVQASFTGAFSASRVVVSEDGSRAFVQDFNTEANGGGIYELGIACDGTLSEKGLLARGNNPAALAFFHQAPRKAVVAARSMLDSPLGANAHLLDFGSGSAARLASGAAFSDADAVASDLAITEDDQFALIADNGIWAGSRLAAVALGSSSLSPLQLLSTPNPVAVVASPFNNAMLVVNSDTADAYRRVRYLPSQPAAPFVVDPGPIVYQFGAPKLPGAAQLIRRGSLKGRVLVAELASVRQLRFTSQGVIEDVSLLALGSGAMTDMVGGIGVTP